VLFRIGLGFLPLDVAFATAGIGTELLAHREKSEMTQPGSQFERSPVPMGRAIAATHGQFAHFLGECLKPETRWRRGRDSNPRYRLPSPPDYNAASVSEQLVSSKTR
jgi:hypothetical protein